MRESERRERTEEIRKPKNVGGNEEKQRKFGTIVEGICAEEEVGVKTGDDEEDGWELSIGGERISYTRGGGKKMRQLLEEIERIRDGRWRERGEIREEKGEESSIKDRYWDS